MTRKRGTIRIAWNRVLTLFGKDVRISRKQREMLGNAYSERIGELLAQLEKFSGEETIFDRDLQDDPIYGSPGGVYHSGEVPPRISLPIGASERTVAHELLHGILDYEHYPRFSSARRKQFPFLTDIGWEVSHCPLHVVIDYRLRGLGYDVLARRVEGAEIRLAALPKLRENVKDIQWEHMWCIRIAREAAEQSSFPPVPATLAARFDDEARRYFPGCGGLIDKFKAIVLAMDVHNPRNVQLSLRRMLAAVEHEYGAYAYFANLHRLSVIGPAFVTTKQLREPAGNTVQADVGMRRNQEKIDKLLARTEFAMSGDVGMLINRDQGRNGTIVVVADRLSGETWAVATSDEIDERKVRFDMDELLKEPLRDFLDYCGVHYVAARDPS